MVDFRLEICVDSLDSVRKVMSVAQPHEIRFEVCSNLISGGGLTPSIGLIRAIQAEFPHIPLMVMIRPRVGSFVYTPPEIEVMRADIIAARDAGVHGVVFGCLGEDGMVDMDGMQSLLEEVGEMQVTFHRAIDISDDPMAALEAIYDLDKVTRVLTSGCESSAEKGLDMLERMTSYLDHLGGYGRTPHPLRILPGAGVNAGNISRIRSRLQDEVMVDVNEFHMSASRVVRRRHGETSGKGVAMGFGPDEVWELDQGKVEDVLKIMRAWTYD